MATAPSEVLLHKEVVHEAEDQIAETAAQVEKLSKEEAIKLVPTLAEDVDYSYFKLGGVLSVIQSNNWWKDDGFDTFKSYIETSFGLQYRKAMYLVNIYNGLVDAEIPWSAVGQLGWTKLKELADILDKDNYKEWVKIAENRTVLQLQEYIREYKKGNLEKGEEASAETSSVSSMTFKVHADQKETITQAIEKAKGEAETDVAAVALEAICMAYLSGGKIKVPSLESLMKKYQPEDILEVFGKVHPSYDITVTINE